MTKNQPRRDRREQDGTGRPSNDEVPWAELADLILIISREIQFRGYSNERAVSLSQSEGMVMRYLLHRSGLPQPDRRRHRASAHQSVDRPASLEHKGLIQREAHPGDGRGVTVRPTERGRNNYALVRREWATAVSTAAGQDTSNLDAALALLATVTDGLVRRRPRT